MTEKQETSKIPGLSSKHPLVVKVTDYYKEGIRGFTAMDKKMKYRDDWLYLSTRLKRKVYNVVETKLSDKMN